MTLVPPEGCTQWQPFTNDPPSVTPPSATLPVVNVADFLDPALFDPPATLPLAPHQVAEGIRLAAASIPEGGGILHFPAGTYEVAVGWCGPILLKSGTWVRGAGRATVLRYAGGTSALLWARAVSNVTISDMVFDVNHGTCEPPEQISINFATAIAVGMWELEEGGYRRAENITIENCVFTTSDYPQRGQTLHAVLGQGVDGLFIRNNHIDRMQLCVAGGVGVTRLVIEDNTFVDPHNLAISAVVSWELGAVSDIRITNNVVTNVPSSGGFFIGTDGDGTDGELLTRVIVRGNVIRGAFAGLSAAQCVLNPPEAWVASGAPWAIIVDLPVGAADIAIEDNIIENTAPVIENNTGGLVLQPATNALRGVRIRGNTFRRFDQEAIRIAGCGGTVLVEDNDIVDARGIYVTAGSTGFEQLTFARNRIRNGVRGIALDAQLGTMRHVLVQDNAIDATDGNWFDAIDLRCSEGRSLSIDVVGNVFRVVGTFPLNAARGVCNAFSSGGTFSVRLLENTFRDFDDVPVVLTSGLVAAARNAGYPTRSDGTVTFTPGVSAIPITHGLKGSPEVTVAAASVYPSSWNGTGLTWVTDVSSSGFTIRCAQAPVGGETFTVAWQAEVSS